MNQKLRRKGAFPYIALLKGSERSFLANHPSLFFFVKKRGTAFLLSE
jgi:hypothetical protein